MGQAASTIIDLDIMHKVMLVGHLAKFMCRIVNIQNG